MEYRASPGRYLRVKHDLNSGRGQSWRGVPAVTQALQTAAGRAEKLRDAAASRRDMPVKSARQAAPEMGRRSRALMISYRKSGGKCFFPERPGSVRPACGPNSLKFERRGSPSNRLSYNFFYDLIYDDLISSNPKEPHAL